MLHWARVRNCTASPLSTRGALLVKLTLTHVPPRNRTPICWFGSSSLTVRRVIHTVGTVPTVVNFLFSCQRIRDEGIEPPQDAESEPAALPIELIPNVQQQEKSVFFSIRHLFRSLLPMPSVRVELTTIRLRDGCLSTSASKACFCLVTVI